jgi:hypothetical protein
MRADQTLLPERNRSKHLLFRDQLTSGFAGQLRQLSGWNLPPLMIPPSERTANKATFFAASLPKLIAVGFGVD